MWLVSLFLQSLIIGGLVWLGLTLWRMSQRACSAAGSAQQLVDRAVAAAGTALGRAERDLQRALGRPVDEFHTLEEVRLALRRVGVTEAVDMAIAIDLTRSNLREDIGLPSLHRLVPASRSGDRDAELNEYQHAIVTLSSVVVPMDTDRQVPLAVFGCERTQDHSVEQVGAPVDCRGAPSAIRERLLQRYAEALRDREFSGPTSFAPAVRWAAQMACSTPRGRRRKFTVLVIVCDGEISPQCAYETYAAIVEASRTAPLGIIIVGVGAGNERGGWHAMETLDSRMPERAFDNVRFVAHDELVRTGGDTLFAVRALQELPQQYSEAARLGLFK